MENSAALFDRAILYRRQGQPQAALTIMDDLIRHHPAMAALHTSRGAILIELRDHAGALSSFEQALALAPDDALSHSQRGLCLQRLGRPHEALDAYDRALALNPALSGTHYNRGTALGELDRLEEALAGYDRALTLEPDMIQALSNKGQVLFALGRHGDGLPSHHRALALRPAIARLHLNTAVTHLALAQYAQGWPLYESRLRDKALVPVPDMDAPFWTGAQPLPEKTLLIHAEQGLGDTIQFGRYAGLALQRGATVILSVPAALVRLMRTLDPAIRVVADDAALPACDYRVMLMSLPLLFGTDANNIPAATPYLAADAERVARWRARLGTQGFKVGICWQGDPQSWSDPGRSIPLHHFAPLAAMAGVRLISLQKEAGTEQLDGAGFAVEQLGADFDADGHAFADSAAVMRGLDLVITSDTAIAHLAGALGTPVWVALKFAPDWRWLLERADCPWYPGMRLLRQKRRGDWTGLFAEIQTALRREVEGAS